MGVVEAPVSWAEIARSNRNRDPSNGVSLTYAKPTEILSFSAAELFEGAKLSNLSLIGMVVVASPSYAEVTKYVKSSWKDVRDVRIHQLRKGIYLFNFQCEDDRAKILEG